MNFSYQKSEVTGNGKRTASPAGTTTHFSPALGEIGAIISSADLDKGILLPASRKH